LSRRSAALTARRRINHPAHIALDHQAHCISRSHHRDCARNHQFARAAVAGRCLNRAFGNLQARAVLPDSNDESRAFHHSGQIRRFHPEMRIGLLADVEQRTAIILDHFDDRTALRSARNADLRILPQGHEFAAAHQHRRRACAGTQRCPGIERLPDTRRALTARVDDDHATFRF
jgi:hypothetical protein